jgi:hypothetical protein
MQAHTGPSTLKGRKSLSIENERDNHNDETVFLSSDFAQTTGIKQGSSSPVSGLTLSTTASSANSRSHLSVSHLPLQPPFLLDPLMQPGGGDEVTLTPPDVAPVPPLLSTSSASSQLASSSQGSAPKLSKPLAEEVDSLSLIESLSEEEEVDVLDHTIIDDPLLSSPSRQISVDIDAEMRAHTHLSSACAHSWRSCGHRCGARIPRGAPLCRWA